MPRTPCPHGRQRSQCKDCGGGGLRTHGRRRGRTAAAKVKEEDGEDEVAVKVEAEEEGEVEAEQDGASEAGVWLHFFMKSPNGR